jgi:uncharacterized protein (DUF58 family)
MRFIKALYLNNRLFIGVGIIAGCFILSFILQGYLFVPQVLFFVFLSLILTDLILLFRTNRGLQGHRFAPEKLSNGDENEIRIYLENFYPYLAALRIIDEIPHQFQRRDLNFYLAIPPGESRVIKYLLRPVKRGEYSFGAVNVFVSSPLGFAQQAISFFV